MGCFTCFTSSKHPKLNKYINKPTSLSVANQGDVKIVLIKASTEESAKSRVSSEDWVINKDVEIREEMFSVKSEDGKEKNVEGSGKLGVLVQRENAKEWDDEKKIKNGILGVLVQIETENERKENNLGVYVETEKEVRTEEYKREFRNGSVSDSSVSSYISYPPMHRFHNCETDEDEEYALIQEDSPESLFSLSIDPTRHSKSSTDEVDDKEVNGPLKTSSSPELNENINNNNESIDYLLNPIENFSQRKTTKARQMLGLDHLQEKENLYIENEEISKPSGRKGKVKTDTVVTTALSSWLLDPEKSTMSNEESQYSRGSDGATSWKSCESRPILGAWSIDEVKRLSARSSPRKSPCRNIDDTPIIGTVGSYWNRTGQTTDSSNSCMSPFGMSAKS